MSRCGKCNARTIKTKTGEQLCVTCFAKERYPEIYSLHARLSDGPGRAKKTDTAFDKSVIAGLFKTARNEANKPL